MRLEQQLQNAGTAIRTADTDRSAAHAQLRYAVKQADRRGWAKTRIAKAAGVSRQTVHTILKEKP